MHLYTFSFNRFMFANLFTFSLILFLIFILVFLYQYIANKDSFEKIQSIFNIYIIILMSIFSFAGIIYIFFPSYLIPSEESFVEQAKILLLNIDLYPKDNKYFPYHSFLYGPALAFIQILAQKLPFSIIINSKIPSLIAFFSFVILTIYNFNDNFIKRINNKYVKFIPINYLLFLIVFSNLVFCIKSEPFLLFLVSFTIFTVNRTKNLFLLSILLGLISGIAMSFKIHSSLYILIAFLSSIRYFKFNIKHFIIYSILYIITICLSGLLPFINSSIDLSSYFNFLLLISKHGIDIQIFIKTFAVLSFLLFPIFIILLFLWFNNYSFDKFTLYKLLLILVLELLLTVIGSKPGIATSHFMPIIPANAFLIFKLLQKVNLLNYSNKYFRLLISFTQSLFIVISLIALINTYLLFTGFTKFWPDATKSTAEIKYLNNKYDNSVLGLSDESSIYLYYNRIYLQSIQIDFIGFSDIVYSGINDDELIDNINNCSYKFYIFPKSSFPFNFKSYYEDKYLLSNLFRESFHKKYKLIENTNYYSIYKCFPK